VTDYLKKNWKIIIFVAVILLAVFLRVYHFSDWLFFKMDQARDALLIKQALENGPGWLPLLGPKAGGTNLNLGPVFYYFQYIAAFLFQSAHPAVLAYPDLLFSILSIPLFYLFLKKYFSREWSMLLAGLYAVCFLGIEYSRFAWNPNSLVFFNLLYFYALLNIFDESIKYKLRWIIVAGLSFAISTQLHFLSFATLPVITVIFVLFSRKEIKKNLGWRKILIFFGIIALVYLPVFFNEIITHGKNTDAFFAAVKSKPSHHSLWKNILRDFRYWGQNCFLILTSWISKKASLNPAILAWLGVMIPGVYLGVKNYLSEKNNLKKKFLLLAVLWFFMYFLIYIPISYQIRPRFFLPLLALPFVFIGFIAKYFWEKNKKILKTAVIAALMIILVGNLYGTNLWFKEIKSAQKKGIYPERTIILKARDGIVLWHLEKAAQFIAKDCPEKRVYYFASAEYRHPIRYMLNQNGIEALNASGYDPQMKGCFYAFGLTRAGKAKNISKVVDQFELSATQKIGALSVYKYSIKPEFSESFSFAKEREEKTSRIFWKDIVK
jgi:4-amino-4-deoxy-L-arabinose transferase-like glycosyltransferase